MIKEERNSATLGKLGLLFSLFSFVGLMFVFQIIGLFLVSITVKKTTIHWVAIVLSVVSLMIDFSKIYAFLFFL